MIEPNTIATTDVDIYNSFDYEVCYSIWYKILGDLDTQTKVQIFEKTDKNLSSSGVLSPKTNIKVTIAIINDNDSQAKVNIGTIAASKQEDSCSLNIADDKNVISTSYKNIDILTTKLLEEKDIVKETEAGYLTYKDITETITFNQQDKIFIATKFTYNNEVFTLTDPIELTLQEFIDEYKLVINNTYFCMNGNKCNILYKITTIEQEKIEQKKPKEDIINYKLTKYDKLIGYSEGKNGLRLVNKNDYVYYGDNPNNFIYYNCENSDNLNTCELWRIVGFFYDEENKEYKTKIIRNQSIGKYQFDYKMIDEINESSNNWNDSTLNKYLNEEYKFKNRYDIYIEEYKQPLERIKSLEEDIKIEDEQISSKINIMSLSDYLSASSCKKNKINEYTGECLINNWLNNIEILKEWTYTSKEITEVIPPEEIIIEETPEEENIDTTNENIEKDETEIETDNEIDTESEEIENNNYVINYVYGIGQNIEEIDVNESVEVRPVVFLKSRIILLDGNGSLEKPYIVK